MISFIEFKSFDYYRLNNCLINNLLKRLKFEYVKKISIFLDVFYVVVFVIRNTFSQV